MRDQFTQQLFVNNTPFTFLFTAHDASDAEMAYLVSVINNPAITPFRMHLKDGHFQMEHNTFVPQEIKDIHYQLNQAINNYHIMQSLLMDKETAAVLKSSNLED